MKSILKTGTAYYTDKGQYKNPEDAVKDILDSTTQSCYVSVNDLVVMHQMRGSADALPQYKEVIKKQVDMRKRGIVVTFEFKPVT